LDALKFDLASEQIALSGESWLWKRRVRRILAHNQSFGPFNIIHKITLPRLSGDSRLTLIWKAGV